MTDALNDAFDTSLPTELQCVVAMLGDMAGTISLSTRDLPAAFSAVTDFKKPAPPIAHELRVAGRLLEFETARLARLVNLQTQTLRGLFANSLQVVDELRFSSAYLEKSPSETLKWINTALNTIADMQEAIEALFPGESFPGN